MAAGLATLRELAEARRLRAPRRACAAKLAEGLREAAQSAGVRVTVNRVGSMLTVFFTDAPVTDYASARARRHGRYARFFHAMLERGVYLAPSQFEAAFVSSAHTERDIADTVAAAEASFGDGLNLSRRRDWKVSATKCSRSFLTTLPAYVNLL